MTYNRLLAALTPELYERLSSGLTTVTLPQGEILHLPGEVIHNLYFPIDCLLSVTITMQDGSTVETGVIGNREVLGVNAFMGGRETTQTEYVVQIGGDALKVDASLLREIFDTEKEFRSLFLKYTQALIAQLSQTTACNRLHKLEQRLGRWLLETQDRVESDEIKLTQQFIAQMLGVRRAGVTQAAQKLQDEISSHMAEAISIFLIRKGWRRLPANASESSETNTIACWVSSMSEDTYAKSP